MDPLCAIRTDGDRPEEVGLGQSILLVFQYFPEPGWVEHDADEIFDVTMAMIKQCVDEGGLSEEFHIPREILPEIVVTGQFSVDTDPDVFFGHAVPIAASAGDQTASAVGQACIKPGMIKNTYGTGSFMVLNTGTSLPENVPASAGLFLETANDIGDELHRLPCPSFPDRI